MSETKPALTPEEWAEHEFSSHYCGHPASFQVDHKGRVFVSDEDTVVILNEAADATRVLPKVAALALHGQPFGFTWDDVDRLRDIAEAPEGMSGPIPALRSLAARIAALLPPREG